MKVLQINAVYGHGSTGRICHELALELEKSGNTVCTIFSQGKVIDDKCCKVSSPLGIKANGLMARLSGYIAGFCPFSTQKILRKIRKYKPDIVHLHNLHANYVNLKKLLSYLARKDIPTVLTLHDCWFYTGRCTHYTTQKCHKWQTGCNRCPQLQKDIPSWFFDRSALMWIDKKRLFSAIPRLGVIGVSDWITEQAKNSILKSAKAIERIYNWIDLSVFYPRGKDIRKKYQLPPNKFLILCIGAGWRKGTERWKDLKALSVLLPQEYHILLVGNVQDADELGKNITSIGYVGSVEELAAIYSSVGVYVHLSREDTFGKVIAESLACGTPAIVYNSTACPELIGEGCGYVVEPGDIEAVFDCIQKVKMIGKDKYFNACKSFVQKNFMKEQLTVDTLEFYQKLIEGDNRCT